MSHCTEVKALLEVYVENENTMSVELAEELLVNLYCLSQLCKTAHSIVQSTIDILEYFLNSKAA